MGNVRYSLVHPKDNTINDICPNLYCFSEFKGFLGLGGGNQYFCAVTNRDLDQGYVNSVCNRNGQYHSCSSNDGRRHSSPRSVPKG